MTPYTTWKRNTNLLTHELIQWKSLATKSPTVFSTLTKLLNPIKLQFLTSLKHAMVGAHPSFST